MEFLDTTVTVSVAEAEYLRLLGYPPGHELDGRARELADATRAWYAAHGRPWMYGREAESFAFAERHVRLAGAEFNSLPLRDQLAAAGAHTALLVAVSAGPECETRAREFWQAGQPDAYFFTEIFGSAVVEHLITRAGARICDWAERQGMAALPHFSPGYSGWDVAEQNKLWELIRRPNPGAAALRLEVLPSGMLRPKKSQLAVFGVTRQIEPARRLAGLVPCESCSFSPCQYRRVPYRHSRPQLEDVRRLQPAPEQFAATSRPVLPLDLDARYSLNLRALRKWSQERLRLEIAADGRVAARFRYDGTTCSNLGQPLACDYSIQLEGPECGYTIASATCQPAPGDTGHTAQCAYLTAGTELLRSIAAEQPLVGQPLDAVLSWQRPANPAGCYCEAGSRAHKWGLVFEVLHFALAERHRQRH